MRNRRAIGVAALASGVVRLRVACLVAALVGAGAWLLASGSRSETGTGVVERA